MKEVKKMYERPSMNRILVQIEDGFVAGSINDDGSSEITINKQGGSRDGIISEDAFGTSWE
jgi:hypothetical protein